MESKVQSTGNLQVTSGLMLLQVYLVQCIFQDILTTPVTVFGHWMLHYDTDMTILGYCGTLGDKLHVSRQFQNEMSSKWH